MEETPRRSVLRAYRRAWEVSILVGCQSRLNTVSAISCPIKDNRNAYNRNPVEKKNRITRITTKETVQPSPSYAKTNKYKRIINEHKKIAKKAT